MAESRKIAAILAADVVGFSRMTSADEDDTLARLRTLRSDLIDPAVATHNGRVFKRTGDGALIEFRSVVDAMRCAIAVQRSMPERFAGVPEDRRIILRIGIHLGDVVEESDGDLMGDGVNIAARLEGVAQPGTICLSEQAYWQVKSRLDLAVTDLGPIQLKNIAEPIRAYLLEVGPNAPTKFATPVELATKEKATTRPTLPDKPSIAVMPFANMSGDSEQEYFADGMVLEIVEALSRIKSIFVVASASSLSFKGKGASPQDVSQQLGVRYILEGSVRKSGGRVRIGVQLIDASDGGQIWTHRFDDKLDDIFALQDAVALAVAGKIEPTVELAEIRRAVARPTESANSHDLYLRALPAFRTYTKDGTLTALDLLSQAIALDAANGPALALAVSCHRAFIVYGWSGDAATNRREGILLAHRAIKAAPDDATVLASVANDLTVLEKSLEAALPLAQRAVSINPGSASVWFNSGFVQLTAGNTELAIQHLENAMRLDPAGPNRPLNLLFLAFGHAVEERFDEALAMVRERNQYSESPSGYLLLAACLGHLRQTGPALAALARYRLLTPLPAEAFLDAFPGDNRHRKLLKDGIALAEGKT